MKKSRILLIAATGLCVLCGAVYLGIAGYYSGGFALNTWINGVYCTGKSIEEANSELLIGLEMPNVIVTDRDSNDWELSGKQVSFAYDYTEGLREYQAAQNPFAWPVRFKTESRHDVTVEVSFDEELLQAYWNSLPFVQEELETEKDVEILRKGTYYVLSDCTSNRLNLEKGYQLLKEALLQGQDELDLVAAGAYEDAPLTEEQRSVLEQWEKVNDFQQQTLIFDMGDTEYVFDGSNRGQFLVRNEDGSFAEDEEGRLVVSRALTDQFIDLLANEYDTYRTERQFLSTRGDVITLSKGIYGTLIDRPAEKEYFHNALTCGVNEVHIPTYEREAYVRGKDDIGDSYIEIDMNNQKMYLYKEGELLVETDVVTGNMAKKWYTPEGINYVYSKETNRILRGADYASFVYYWMPVNGGYGIHDATWRSGFGGDIYKTNGSHGCINTPLKYAKEIFENIEVGYPVIMFY